MVSKNGISFSVVMAMLMVCSGAWGATIYDCTFEPGSQGSAFTTGALTGQGTPAWSEYYSSGYDVGGVVTSATAHAGTQSAYVEQYQTSRVDLGAVYRPKWIEWAFCPNLSGGGDQQPTSQFKMFNLRGPIGEMVGIYTWVQKDAGHLMFWSSGGNIDLGAAPDGVWKTISFEHTIHESGVYTGAVNVYVDGVFKGAYSVGNGTAYNGVQTMVFSTTSGSWVEDGAGYFDSIHMGDASVFVPEPATLLMVGSGLVMTWIRRRK